MKSILSMPEEKTAERTKIEEREYYLRTVTQNLMKRDPSLSRAKAQRQAGALLGIEIPDITQNK